MQLETHLKLLERQGLIQPWHDRRIQPGVDFRAIASSFQRILVASVVAEWTLPVA
jgi:hypothetical protein